jgi:transcriptional regulator with XRE-family HTH domain
VPEASVNVAALYAALDAQRKAQHLSWRQLAKAVDISPSTLTRMANEYRPDLEAFASLVSWLGVPAERFITSDAQRDDEPDLVAQLAPLLRARRDLAPGDVAYLEDLIAAAAKRFRHEREERTAR